MKPDCDFVVGDARGALPRSPIVEHRAEQRRSIDEGLEIGGGGSHADRHVERAQEKTRRIPITALAAAGSDAKLCSTSRTAPRW